MAPNLPVLESLKPAPDPSTPIQQLTFASIPRFTMPQITNYRTIDIDSLDPESPANFPISSLLPSNLPPPTTSSAAASLASQIRQLLRSGDTEGALRHVLDSAPLGGDDRAKEVHLASVVEVLQGIRQTEMTKVLEAVCNGEGGAERGDCLMKYLYVDIYLLHMSLMPFLFNCLQAE